MRFNLLWLPLTALLAGACITVAIDRQVEQTARSGMRPGTLSVGPRSDRQRVLRALADRDVVAARWSAASAIRRAPLDAVNASLYAAIEGLTGHPAAQRQAMTVAAALGWRDPAMQSYWLGRARATSDFRLAADIADAALRTGTGSQQARDILVDMEAVPPGREAIADRLAANPPWLAVYFEDLRAFPADLATDRTRTILLALRRGLRGDCVLSGVAAQGMIQNGAQAAAAALWQATCDRSASPRQGISDSGFDRVATDQRPSPFRWTLLSSGPLDVSVATGAAPLNGNALTFRSSSSADEPIARQTMLLTPGDYRLTWLERDRTGREGSIAAMAMFCIAPPARIDLTTLATTNPDRRAAAFTIAPDGCAAQSLTIIVPGSADGAIDDVVVTPVGR